MNRCVRVKICGIRSHDDLELALQAGADAVGFIVGARHRTEDELPLAEAARLVARLPPFVSGVLVTHLLQAEAIVPLVRQLAVGTLQLQDQLPAAELEAIRAGLPGIRLIQAVHVTDASAVATAEAAAPLADALLLDSRTHDRIGGTGRTHDWSISRRIVAQVPVPVILAGGLNPANLAAALAAVNPAAVDVNSGVEDAAGAKEPERVRTFVRIGHGWGGGGSGSPG